MILSRAQALWLIPVAFAIHNAEEAVMFPSCLPRVIERLPEAFQPMIADIPSANLRVALLGATLVPFVLLVWATFRPNSVAALWSALTVQCVVAINVLSHVTVAAMFMRGYSPGLLSAIFINAPMSIYLLRRAARERWLPGSAARMLLPTALLIHGPGLFGVLLLSRSGH